MKKLFALMMAVAMLLSVAALAEEATSEELTYSEISTEIGDDYVQVALSDLDSAISLPSDWGVAELTQEQIDAGLLYGFAKTDLTKSMTVAVVNFDAAVTDASIAADYANAGQNVMAVSINGIRYLLVEMSDTEVVALYLWDDTTAVTFDFQGAADDAEMSDLMMTILGSFC